MGSENTNMNIHICGLDINDKENYKIQMETLNKLFSKEDKNKSTSDYKVRYSEEPKWNAFIYSDENTNNFSLINQTIQNQINMYNGEEQYKRKELEKKHGSKNHMIILFVNENNTDELLCEQFSQESTINDLSCDFPLILFLFKNIDRNNSYYKDLFFDFSYIKCENLNKVYNIIKNKQNLPKSDLMHLYLKSLLYNNYDSYFTERGHKLIDEIDPFSERPILGIYLPILLVGSPGVGKSTFINILNDTRISKASDSEEPVTSNSAIYDVKIPGNDNNDILLDNEELKQEAFIRFIDTPGFDLEKDIEIALKQITKIFDDFKEGKERIPVVLYFINPIGRNSTKDKGKQKKELEILKYLQKNKIKIIFVITHIPKRKLWTKKKAFFQHLKENGLENLVEKNESNIIKCELVGDNAYGIKEIFKKIYEYTNFIEDSKYEQTDKLYEDSLIEEIKKYKTFDDKLKFLKTKTNLFNEFQSKEDLLTYANIKSKALISSMVLAAAGAGAIPFPFADIPIVISIVGGSIIKIGKFYGYVWKNISKKDLISVYNGEIYHNDHIHENTDSSANINLDFQKFLNLIKDIFFKSVIIGILSSVDDILKCVWGIGSAIGIALGVTIDSGLVLKNLKNAKQYFESKCRADDGTLFFIARCSEYEIIFRKFKQFEDYDLIYPSQ